MIQTARPNTSPKSRGSGARDLDGRRRGSRPGAGREREDGNGETGGEAWNRSPKVMAPRAQAPEEPRPRRAWTLKSSGRRRNGTRHGCLDPPQRPHRPAARRGVAPGHSRAAAQARRGTVGKGHRGALRRVAPAGAGGLHQAGGSGAGGDTAEPRHLCDEDLDARGGQCALRARGDRVRHRLQRRAARHARTACRPAPDRRRAARGGAGRRLLALQRPRRGLPPRHPRTRPEPTGQASPGGFQSSPTDDQGPQLGNCAVFERCV